MSTWKPSTLVLHDYGGTPQNREGVFNPYHALVFPDGSIRYRDPANPYGRPAPHAYRLNPESIGLSYAGPVGSQPTAAAMATLKAEAEKVATMFPGIRPMGHGEAFQATKGTGRQASRDGRDLVEASWRSNVVYGPPAPGQTQVAAGPVPMSARGLTTFAGLAPQTPAAPPVTTASATPASTDGTGATIDSIVNSVFPTGGNGEAANGGGLFGSLGGVKLSSGDTMQMAQDAAGPAPAPQFQHTPLDPTRLREVIARRPQLGFRSA